MVLAQRPSAPSFLPAPSTIDRASAVRTRAHPRLLWAVLSLLSLAATLAAPRAGWGAVLPGAIPGGFAVGDQGAATYTIPIVAPAATGGLKPNLALSYNHSAGNGLAGMRWNLIGISAIGRCGRTYAQDGSVTGISYTNADAFCLNGQRLVATVGSHGVTGTEYRTEIETFQRIQQLGSQGGGPDSFRVNHGNGVSSYFGATADSRVEITGGGTSGAVKLWYISHTEDQFGNRINYTYTENNATGETVPNEVLWTENTQRGLTPKYKATIVYEDRPPDDVRTGHDSANKAWAVTKRIDKIDVLYGAQLIHTYDLTYAAAGPTGRSRLQQVQLCRGLDCVPATTFAVQGGTSGWSPMTDTGYSVGTGPVIAGDINGDGRQDIVVAATSGNWHVYYGNANGSLNAAVDTFISAGPNPWTARLIDFDSDGIDQLLFKSSSTWRVLTLTGTTFMAIDTGVSITAPTHAAIADYDGDGIDDWLYYESGSGKWRRNTGGTFAAAQTLFGLGGSSSTLLYDHPNRRAPDFNGDGRDDIIHQSEYCEPGPEGGELCTPVWTVLVASGTSSYTAIHQLQGYFYADIFYVNAVDLNGDGLDDLMFVATDTWYTQLSTATGFAPATATGIPWVSAEGAIFADYDSDGREDYLRSQGGTLYIHRSNGTTVPMTPTTSLATAGLTLVADISGDAFPELIGTPFNGTLRVHPRQTALPDVVTSVTDGLGYSVGLTYESQINSTHYTVNGAPPVPPYTQYVRKPRHIVTSETHDDGIGETGTLDHYYDTQYMDVSGRDWAVFSTHRVNDLARGTHTLTQFSQSFPTVGRVIKRELRRTSDIPSENKLIRDVQVTVDSTPIVGTTPNRHFVRVESETIREYEVGGVADSQHLRTIVDDPAYDTTYGHVTAREVKTTDPVTSEEWKSTTIFNATVDTDDWCLGLPGLVVTTNSVPGQPQAVRRLNHTFYADTCRLQETRDESDSANPAKQLKATFVYDNYGNPDVVSQDSVDGSAQNRSTDFDFDPDGQQPTSVTLGTVDLTTTFTWDYLSGQRMSVTGTDGLTTSWRHDPFGRVIQETRPDGSTTITRTACGGTCWPQNAVFFARAEGSDGSDDYEYFDELGRSVGRAWVLPGGTQGRAETLYTSTGEVDQVSRPYLDGDPVYWVKYVHDLIGRQVQENAPTNEANTSGSLTTTDYRGHDLWLTDAEGRTTKYTHNAARQIEQVLDALNGSTAYTYAPFGELATVTDHQSNVTTIGYDARGLKTSSDDPDLGLWNYAYNVYDELVSETDPKTYPNPTRTYSHDAGGRIEQRIESEGTTTFTYYSAGVGAIGKPNTISGPGNSEHYEYSSSLGAPTLVRRVIDGATYETNYAYHTTGGGQGKLSRITYPTSSLGTRLKADYSYDSFGQLYQVKNGDVPSLVWYTLSSADALGRERTAIFGNGVNEVRTYDRANGALQSIASGPTGTPTSVQNLTYQWDRVGSLTQRRDFIPGKTEDFVYDALSRLRTVQVNSATALSVDYDAIGNISYKSDVGTYAYGAGSAGPHAVTSVSGIQSNTYQYDGNGNMNNKDGDTITWYSFNKPLRMNYGSAYSEMTYGVHRQRIKQSAVGYGAGALYYVGPEFELLTQGPLRADLHYIFANGRAIARYTTYNFQGPDTRYLHRDSLGSIVATSSDTGSVLSRYEFDAFGLRWQTAGSGLFTQKGFTGHEHLDTVDLIDMVGRVQDPVLGRFISADPFVQAPDHSQSLNRYSYVWNNPSTFVDPSGFGVEIWPLPQWLVDAFLFEFPVPNAPMSGVTFPGAGGPVEDPTLVPQESPSDYGLLPSDNLLAQVPPTLIFTRPPVTLEPLLRPLPQAVRQGLKPETSPVPQVLRPSQPQRLTPAEALRKYGPQLDELRPGVQQPESLRVGPKNFDDTGLGLLYRILKAFKDIDDFFSPPPSAVPTPAEPPPPVGCDLIACAA